jgi:hypothetical protein
LYYEVTASAQGAGPGAPSVDGQALVDGSPHYIELDANVLPGDKHKLSVLEMYHRNSWWRVWVDNKPVSPPLHLADSHGKWYPQALAENWNGGTGACNTYAYRFSNVKLAHTNGGVWRALKNRSLFHDAGYQVLQTSRDPSNFVTTSLG